MFDLSGISHHGWIALLLGSIFTLIMNVGLMWMIRKSRDSGTDATVYKLRDDSEDDSR
ncbi:hypothetical protein [Hwanghaeella sp.]|uniref:hypothetical protein n=1 Tax=Hwanghaeella sp. TaxID=2605943 RepID=UPI003CCBDD0D